MVQKFAREEGQYDMMDAGVGKSRSPKAGQKMGRHLYLPRRQPQELCNTTA